jgi:hypothetical protein
VYIRGRETKRNYIQRETDKKKWTDQNQGVRNFASLLLGIDIKAVSKKLIIGQAPISIYTLKNYYCHRRVHRLMASLLLT